MPKVTPSNDPSAAVREILAAIAKGTRKVSADQFFSELQQRLRAYKASQYDELAAWLRTAGIRNALTREQAAAAAKVARRKHGGALHPHQAGAVGY